MKSEEQIEKQMNLLKDSLPEIDGQELIMSQASYRTLRWVLSDEEEEESK